MNLTQTLINLRRQLTAYLPAEVKALISRITQELTDSGLINRSLKVGETAPNFIASDAMGHSVELAKLLQSGRVVITFYRGIWCSYCNSELQAFQKYLPEIEALGATLIAISPQTIDRTLATVEKHDLTFPVLSDFDNAIARQFGLVFTLPAALRSIYENAGIDLPAHNGSVSFELPVPATYILDQDGTVIRAFVDPDYTKRLDPIDVLVTLRNLEMAA